MPKTKPVKLTWDMTNHMTDRIVCTWFKPIQKLDESIKDDYFTHENNLSLVNFMSRSIRQQHKTCRQN